MSNNEIVVPSTGRAGQSTQIEQARAMAQVHAMMSMAKQYPRDIGLATDRMRDACGRLALAEKAFFRFPRGGKQVSGPSVHLARELARCWGNMDYGVSELARDDYELKSEMLAQAWDIETNTRTYAGFILPHKRDVEGGTKPLYTMREIYENNANAGARRLRECIYAQLPVWYREEAQKLCRTTVEEEIEKEPRHETVAKAIHWYATKGVKQEQLADKLGKPSGQWTAGDLALLRVIMESLKANETTVELEFPTVFTRSEDIAGPVAEVETRPGKPAAKTEQWQDVQPPKADKSVLETATSPAADYVCDVCQAVGEHFQDVCPQLADSTDD